MIPANQVAYKVLPVIASDAPLGMKPDAYRALGLQDRAYWTGLSAFKAPYLEEKMLLEGECRDGEQYRERFDEWKKFVGLAHTTKGFLGMPSERVDAVWHQFILFTRDYHAFCKEFTGGYFHHVPNIPSRPQGPDGVDALVRAYVPLFGPLPEVWDVCGHRQEAALKGVRS